MRFPGGRETQNCNGVVQNLNLIDLGGLSQTLYNWDGNFTEKNRLINHIAGSYNQTFVNGGTSTFSQAMHNGDIDLNEYSLQDLLGVASNASVDRSSVQFGLTSLQNLLTSSPNLASIFSTKEQLLPLYECFSVSVASESNILQLCF